jgi:hypothetical protein
MFKMNPKSMRIVVPCGGDAAAREVQKSRSPEVQKLLRNEVK